MEPLIQKSQLRGILERGLVTGKWSIMQFNSTSTSPTLPSREFLERHPQFLDMHFRDLEAYRKHHHRSPL